MFLVELEKTRPSHAHSHSHSTGLRRGLRRRLPPPPPLRDEGLLRCHWKRTWDRKSDTGFVVARYGAGSGRAREADNVADYPWKVQEDHVLSRCNSRCCRNCAGCRLLYRVLIGFGSTLRVLNDQISFGTTPEGFEESGTK